MARVSQDMADFLLHLVKANIDLTRHPALGKQQTLRYLIFVALMH